MPIKRQRKGVLSSLVDKGLDRFLSADPKAPPSSSHRQQGRSGSQSSDSSSSSSDSACSSSSEAGRGDRHRNRSLPSRPPKTVQTESRSPVPVPWPYPNMSITECLLSKGCPQRVQRSRILTHSPKVFRTMIGCAQNTCPSSTT
jgi:hypothetical protein